MSVRMALAKLCACTCGGAIIGGGAVHVAENPPSRPSFVKRAKAANLVKQAPRRYARVKAMKRYKRVRTACVVKTPGTTTTTRTITYPGSAMPIPLPPLPSRPEMSELAPARLYARQRGSTSHSNSG